MFDTPATLLHRLCDRPIPADWERFVRLFTPLLQRWAIRLGVPENAVEDLLQELFVLLIKKFPDFRHDPTRSFRAWLWTVFRNTIATWRKRLPAVSLTDDECVEIECPDGIGEFTDAEYRGFLLSRVLQIIKTDFPNPTWEIFQQVAIVGRPAAEVAAEFQVTANAVYLARSRVLARLRQELTGLDH